MKDKSIIQIGKIVTTHGIKGDVSVLPWADYPEDLLDLEDIYINGKEYTVTRARIQKNNVIIHIEGIDSIEDAEKMRNAVISVSRDYFQLEEGEYFWEDLIGLEVEDKDTGVKYGILKEVVTTGANDCYEVVDDNGRSILFPAIAESEIRVDLEAGKMYLKPIPGLLDL